MFSPLETPKDEDRDFLSSIGAESTDHSLQLNYDIWPADKILRAVLPSGAEVTSAFESVGHIAHVNLRDSQLEYKRVIGEVLLDKNCPRVRTVVNKTSNIEETYRFFKMELLAGDDDMVATVKENGCTFTFDFSKVYWNSRLHTEHKRIVDLLRPGDVVYDVFAGVGPFAIPAAKRGCVIYANDLNPDSFQYLATNARNNGVLDRVKTFNLDGREFLRKVVEKSSPVSHVIMNLPAMAVDFLDVFSGGLFGENSPMIYCYCFSKAEDVVRDAQVQCERVLGANLDACVHYVRDVAPNKAMMCVQFRLPRQVGAKQENGGEGERIIIITVLYVLYNNVSLGPPLKKTKH